MLQGLLHRDSLVKVKNQHSAQKVQCLFGRFWKKLIELPGLLFRQIFYKVSIFLIGNHLDFLRTWRTDDVEGFEQLIRGALPREKGLSSHQLRKDDASRPNIHWYVSAKWQYYYFPETCWLCESEFGRGRWEKASARHKTSDCIFHLRFKLVWSGLKKWERERGTPRDRPLKLPAWV